MSMPYALPQWLRWSRNLILVAGALLLAVLPPVTLAQNGPNLAVTKTCAVNGQSNGQQSILCTVTITNIGANASLAPVTINDTPTAPAGSTFTGTSGWLGCSPGMGPVQPLSCHANLSFQPGQTETALFSFTIPQGAGFSNCVTVTLPRDSSNPGDLSPANNTNICASLGGGDGGGEGSGSVTFAKQVVNRTGRPTPRSFDIQYQCQPDASTVVNLSLTAPTYQQVVQVAAGAQCKFVEVAPMAPKGCHWIVTYPNGQYGHDGDRLVVRNELSCGGGGGGDDKGSITFVKKILNETGQRVTGPFELEVKCEPSPGSGSVLLAAPAFQQSISVAANAKCKFQEVMPRAPKGCHWNVNYPNGQVAHAGDTMYVENVLTCGAGGGGDDPKVCPRGSSLTTFPGSDATYCCNGKPGSDEFCCTRVDRKIPGKR